MTGKETYENKYKNKINNIIDRNPDMTYLKGFYNYMKSSRTAYSTMYDYLNYVVNFMNHNQESVENLCLDHYTDFISQFSEMKLSYQIGVYSGLKKFAIYLLDSQKTSINPMEHIKRPRFQEDEETKAKREIGYLDKKEIKKYLSVAEEGVGSQRAVARQKNWKERDILIIKIFLTTGIRCSALYKLDVDKIDINNKELLVTDKGNKVKRCDISDDIVKCYLSWIEKRKIILDGKEENALFISNQKTRMDQKSIARVVKKYAEPIEGKHITPHKLRATFGTQLYNETGDLYFVQDLMGHSNPKVTELYIRGTNSGNGKRGSDIMSQLVK